MTSSAAFFDLDKTIISKSSTLAFGKPLYQAGLVNRRTLVQAIVAQVVYKAFGADHDQLEKVKEQLSGLTKGWDLAEVESLVGDTVDEVVSPHVYIEALELIEEHRAAGRMIVIVSSSPFEVVQPIAHMLGVDEVIATRSKIVDGIYTGEVVFYAYAEGKVVGMEAMAVDRGISLADSFAYSDSFTDVPMLEAVGHPVVVNPDKELREYAEERDWEIREFSHDVNLRTRIADMPKPDAAMSAMALASAAGVGLITYLVKRRARAGT